MQSSPSRASVYFTGWLNQKPYSPAQKGVPFLPLTSSPRAGREHREVAARGRPAGVAGPSSAGLTGRGLADLVGMRVASVAAGVLLAHVGDGGVGMRRLDLEPGDEGVLGLDRHLVRLAPDPDPDRVLHGHGCSLLLLRSDAPSRVNVDAHLPKKELRYCWRSRWSRTVAGKSARIMAPNWTKIGLLH